MEDIQHLQTERQLQTQASKELRRLGVEIDASDHRDPATILAALAQIGGLGIKTAVDQPSLAKRRAASPYLAF